MKRKPSLPTRELDLDDTWGNRILKGELKKLKLEVRNHPVQPLILHKYAETLRDWGRGVSGGTRGLVSCLCAVLPSEFIFYVA